MKLLVFVLLILAILTKPDQKYQTQKIITDILQTFQQEIIKIQLLSSNISSLFNLSSSPPCTACHSFFSSLSYLPSTTTIHVFQKIAVEYCTLAKLQIKQVCKGAIKEMTKFLILSLFHKYTDPRSICHKLKLCPKQYNILSANQYAKQLLKDKPDKKQEKPTRRKIMNVLHVSDIHIDFFYMEGTPTYCDEPLCCRGGVKARNDSKPAGYWGSNKGDCDLPYHTFNLFLEQVKNKDIDMIIWTGDNTAHDIWKQSEAYNLNHTTIISNRFKDVFPGIPVLPTIGNHQSFPVNVYDFGNQSTFNTILASAWGDWVDENALQQIKENAFFHTKIQKYNLVLISLNTQAWNNQNWVLLKDPTDPGGMLKWMEKVLRQAESDGNFVFIIGHVPPTSAIIQYARRYNAIIDRFNYIIRGQFYGHYHNQYLSFFTAINDTQQRIIGNFFVPPSLTTASNKNSNFRIMKVDVDTMRVVDFEQYALKLENNYSKDVKPPYELTYTFLNEYGLENMQFEGLEQFRRKLRNDSATQIKYSYHTHGDIEPGKASATLHCETYPTAEMKDICAKGKFQMSMFEKVSGVWRQLKNDQQ